MSSQLLLVDVADVERRLPSLGDDSVEELYRFGTWMVSSAQQRTTRLDAKLTGILGWSSAALAFVLVDGALSKPRGLFFVAVIVAVAVTTASIVSACLGLKSRVWPAPSERDWFRDGVLESAETLKRYHIVSMLNIHHCQADVNYKRAKWLMASEILLALSASAIFVTLVSRLF
jgi:hypothetical protein